jgi:hypothetical protein
MLLKDGKAEEKFSKREKHAHVHERALIVKISGYCGISRGCRRKNAAA